MANVLFLVHRLPYPPNKGDKVRSYHLLEHLSRRHRVFLGTFVDDEDDHQHVPEVERRCADACCVTLRPNTARLASLTALACGRPMTLDYYSSTDLRRWVRRLAARERLDVAVVFSSSMAQYAESLGIPLIVDFVDVDSAKWTEYARHHWWPLSWLYRREGRSLAGYERRAATQAARSFFVTDSEAALFLGAAPELAARVEAVGNGVDFDYFSPDSGRANPFDEGELPIVFTGAMDYWPNIDAVTWFAADILPKLLKRWPNLRFHIVGRSPTPAVRQLASESVRVSGTVPDVRPYLQHAAVVVAPLRLARGIQNKLLEAMAMARPVVASAACAGPVGASPGKELLAAGDAGEFEARIDELLAAPARARAIGSAGREYVMACYSWDARLAPVDRTIETALGLARAGTAAGTAIH